MEGEPGNESALCKYLLHKRGNKMAPENDPKHEEELLTGKMGTALCKSQLAFQENNRNIIQHILGTIADTRHCAKHFPCVLSLSH